MIGYRSTHKSEPKSRTSYEYTCKIGQYAVRTSMRYSDLTINIFNNYDFSNERKAFNQDVHLGEHTYDYFRLFFMCENLNSTVTIDGTYVERCVSMFYNCVNFNCPITLRDTHYPNCANMFENCINFNSPVTIYSACNLVNIFKNCYSLNQPINLGDIRGIPGNSATSGNIQNAFYGCTSLNSKVIITHANSLSSLFSGCSNFNQSFNIPEEVISCDSLFLSCVAYNQMTIVPSNVNNAGRMFSGCTGFENTVYFKGNEYRDINVAYSVARCNNLKRKNIYFNSALNNKFNITNSSSIVGASITWTTMANGFYNSTYNVYCYYNYDGVSDPF